MWTVREPRGRGTYAVESCYQAMAGEDTADLGMWTIGEPRGRGTSAVESRYQAMAGEDTAD
jgi:hypothetical protein